MEKRYEVPVGGFVTALYVGGVICLMATRHVELSELDLNELGDFLAGAFGPMAFLWVVLGFIQQGRELKVSSDALVAQSLELSQSVKHSAGQLKLAQEKFELESQGIAESMRPRIKMMYVNSGSGMTKEWLNFELLVYNAEAIDLVAAYAHAGTRIIALSAGFVGARKELELQASFASGMLPTTLDFTIECEDTRGRKFSYLFRYIALPKGKGEILDLNTKNSVV